MAVVCGGQTNSHSTRTHLGCGKRAVERQKKSGEKHEDGV